MPKLMLIAVILLLAVILSTGQDTTRLARHRHRVLHHRYPQTFRFKPDTEQSEIRRKDGFRPSGYRPSQTFELPSENRQPWGTQSNRNMQDKVLTQQQHRRPVDIYGSPPVNWPMRPPSGRPQQPNPHDIYGPPAELPPNTSDDDIRDGGFRADYEYEQYPEEDFQDFQQPGVQQKHQKSTVQQSQQYVGATPSKLDAQRKQEKEDKIENFEIPLEFLRGMQTV